MNQSRIETDFEALFQKHMQKVCDENPDPSHDMLHVERVVALARRLAAVEGADLAVVVPAAYLHDCVYISKTDERRTRASRISADKAIELLRQWKYPEQFHSAIHHAIAAHSFSAKIPAETIEAKVVQDADRLDAIGAVGIFRCFAFSGLARRPMNHPEDPFCDQREPNDQTNTLDHFYTKLLHLHGQLTTNAAKVEGEKRLATMNRFLADMRTELLS